MGPRVLGTETQSLDYLSSANKDNHSTHYWIGRTKGLLYSITPEEKLTYHAGNPKKHPTVKDHNARSIGIEMYQIDPAVTRKAGGTPDFTDWQYDTVVQLVYDICYRRKIKRSMVVAHGTINPIDRADPKASTGTNSSRRSISCRSGWAAWVPSTSSWTDVRERSDRARHPAPWPRSTIGYITDRCRRQMNY